MSRIEIFAAISLLVLLSASASAQTTAARPDRGLTPGGAYSVTDVESISLTNGNLNLSIPLASLPPIAGGKLSFSLNAVYNSKLWDVVRHEERAPTLDFQTYVVDTPQASERGGWSVSGGYRIVFRNATEDFDYVIPDQSQTTPADWQALQYRWFKVLLISPDGAETELRPTDSIHNYQTIDTKREYLFNYYRDTPDSIGAPMRYYSYDGTRVYAIINPGTASYTISWTLYMPDGTQVVQYKDGVQRIKDTNGNSIKIFSDASGTHYQDEQTGREIKYVGVSATEGQVLYQTVGGAWMAVTIKYGTTRVQGQVYRVNDWNQQGGELGSGECGKDVLFDQTVTVVREIIFPATEPGKQGRRFTFEYNSDATEPVSMQVRWGCGQSQETYTGVASLGYGALSRMVTPSGATVDYKYYHPEMIAPHRMLSADELVRETIDAKTLTHDGVTDAWDYNINVEFGHGSVVNPDGTFSSETGYPANPVFAGSLGSIDGKGGLVYRSNRSDKVVVERHWTLMPFAGANTGSAGASGKTVSFNPVVDAEYTSLMENGVAVRMSATTFKYDFNGNLTETIQYDWFDPSLVSRDAQGVPTGVPASAVQLRRTTNSFYNPAPDAASANVYAKRPLDAPSPLILNAVSESIVGASRTQFSYDGQGYGAPPIAGNLTRRSSFDDQGDSSPSNDRWVEVASTYGTYGNLATTTDANGNLTQFFYDDTTHALPTRVVVDPLNGTGQQTSQTVYDFWTGLVTSTTDANGQTTTIDYVNQLLGTVDPFGRPGKITSPLVLVEGASKRHTTVTTYEDEARRVTVESDLRNEGDRLLKSRTTSDQLGRPVLSEQSEDGLSYTISTRSEYEQMGRIVYTSNPVRAGAGAAATDGWTRTTRDAAGRVVETATFSGASRPSAPTPCTAQEGCTGAVATAYYADETTVTDQAGKKRRSFVDAAGRLVKVVEAPGVANFNFETTYVYDALNNLKTVVQGGQTRTFIYSSLSRLVSARNPEFGTSASPGGTAITYEYDPNGNLKKKTDARGITVSYTYDGLNRPELTDYSDSTPDVTYAYDSASVANSKGRLTSVSTSVSATSYTDYDALGRIKASTQTTGGRSYSMAYGYDLAGNLITQQYPSGKTVETLYDSAGRVAGVRNQQSGQFYAGGLSTDAANRINYTAHGAVAQMRLGNGLWERTNFNSRLQTTRIGLGASASNDILQLDYDYNGATNNGNLASQTITLPGHAVTQSYTYDELNRLAQAVETVGAAQQWKQKYNYDRYGNRTLDATTTLPGPLNDTNNPSISAANNRITSAGYKYDEAGNLNCAPQHPCGVNGEDYFAYDGENRISSAGGGGAVYRYDGDGRRVKKQMGQVETVFVYNAMGQMVAEYTSQSAQSAGGVSYLTTDTLGSTRVVTDGQGGVRARHDYLPFGEEISAGVGGRTTAQGYSGNDGNRFKFAQLERDDETGLDYAQARYYASTQGRFTSIDPLMASGRTFNPQSWNRYAYVLNNPLNLTDPTGTIDDDPDQQERRPLPPPLPPPTQPIILPPINLPPLPQTPPPSTGPVVDPVAFEQEFGPSPLPRGTMTVRNGIQEHRAGDIDPQCGANNAGACTSATALTVTTTATNGTEWRARNVDLRIYGEMWISTGPFPYRGRQPVDRTVVDSETARDHEYNAHINVAIDAVRPVINEFLGQTFRSEREFRAAADRTLNRVSERFRNTLRQTQNRERNRR